MRELTVIGVDLAGTPRNPSGFAKLCGDQLETREIYSDADILELCERSRPKVVAIDAPLSLPARGNLRLADESLIERGFRVFPPTFKSMRSLTERGMRIASELRAKGIRVIEIHPRTSGMALFGTPDRAAWVPEFQKHGWRLKPLASEHEIDAVAAAITGLLWLEKKTEEIGNPLEGAIVIPRGRLRVPARA